MCFDSIAKRCFIEETKKKKNMQNNLNLIKRIIEQNIFKK